MLGLSAKNAQESIGALKEFATEFLVPFSEDLSAHIETVKKVIIVPRLPFLLSCLQNERIASATPFMSVT